MAVVKLYASLRSLAGTSQFEVPGGRLAAVLEELCTGREFLRIAIFDGDRLRAHLRVLINGCDSELREGLGTPLKPDDQISIFPPITGGLFVG
jgi:sulfur-carrier protein